MGAAKTPPSRRTLLTIYRRLLDRFGPRGWWPADTPFEVAVGAVLTQSTAWANVEQAIAALKRARALSPRRLLGAPIRQVARWIRPAGYFNLKARRLRALVAWWARRGDPVITTRRQPVAALRRELLMIYGVGPETADSLLLYALGRPAFVVDAYTKRIFARHGWAPWGASYEELQGMFTRRLPPRAAQYNEYHALLVELGKTFCAKRRPRCHACPLRGVGAVRLEAGARMVY
ncbi:MAG: endonuclease III domain-containing protein [Candidatus Omnitrophica bacterium]|nr:endonuclease III domain-containing protein [Candidatus Omnitrophota bacterium]